MDCLPRPGYLDKQNKQAEQKFTHLMQMALRLSSGKLTTNDPKVWKECAEFIRVLSSESAWHDKNRLENFKKLKAFFLEPSENVRSSGSPSSTHKAARFDPLSETYRPDFLPIRPEELFNKLSDAARPVEKVSGATLAAHLVTAARIHESLWETFQHGRVDGTLDFSPGNDPASVLDTLDKLKATELDGTTRYSIEALRESVTFYKEKSSPALPAFGTIQMPVKALDDR